MLYIKQEHFVTLYQFTLSYKFVTGRFGAWYIGLNINCKIQFEIMQAMFTCVAQIPVVIRHMISMFQDTKHYVTNSNWPCAYPMYLCNWFVPWSISPLHLALAQCTNEAILQRLPEHQTRNPSLALTESLVYTSVKCSVLCCFHSPLKILRAGLHKTRKSYRKYIGTLQNMEKTDINIVHCILQTKSTILYCLGFDLSHMYLPILYVSIYSLKRTASATAHKI